MFNNFYVRLKKCMKENLKTILFFIGFYIFLMWPVDYYILAGGGTIKIGDRIKVEDAFPSKGSLNLAYVSEYKGTLATYTLSYMIPSWERIKITDYTYDEEESKEEVEFRGDIDLLTSSDNAIKNAFESANKTYKVTSTELYIYYVEPESENSFEVGDQILKIDDVVVESMKTFQSLLTKYQTNQEISITVKRNGKEKKLKSKLYEKDGKSILGIYVTPVNQYKTYPKVEINFKKGESGPSGGLIEALDIYNKLTKEDLTNGLKVVGTGEIDSDGNILEIGGVKYKLIGAVKDKADIFLVPKGENYDECIKLQKKKNLKIKIIGVSTLEEAIQKLNSLKK